MPVKENISDDFLQQTRIKGRVGGSEHIKTKSDNSDGFFRTLLVVPAVDEYSHPSTYAINASAPLGIDGQDVDVLCNVRPFSRTKDGNKFYNTFLWLVEKPKESDVPF